MSSSAYYLSNNIIYLSEQNYGDILNVNTDTGCHIIYRLDYLVDCDMAKDYFSYATSLSILAAGIHEPERAENYEI
ncbi:hypothetical protein TRIP_C20669 [Candidatus Zixiibacteriota bacterium]|nr:hypothetical protein TRIP_C20669 [candidate division Zixibacteria bacterium]